MGEYVPLFLAVGTILFIAVAVPMVVGVFVDVESLSTDSVLTPVIDIVQDGFELSVIPFVNWDDFNINPFSWLGGSLHDYLIESLVYISILPEWLIFTLAILLILALIYTVIKILPTT